MLTRVIFELRQSALKIENHIFLVLGRRYPPDGFSLVGVDINNEDLNKNLVSPKSFSLNDIINNAILWAVPKHRRSAVKVSNRKFGWPDKVWKPLVPKKNLVMCKSCGDHHEAGHLCSTCYNKVKLETEEMQKMIENQLGLSPNDKEVVVLYQGEKQDIPEEFFQGKRIVEMKKERPQWFSKNLLEKTTQAPSTATSIKPTDLA